MTKPADLNFVQDFLHNRIHTGPYGYFLSAKRVRERRNSRTSFCVVCLLAHSRRNFLCHVFVKVDSAFVYNLEIALSPNSNHRCRVLRHNQRNANPESTSPGSTLRDKSSRLVPSSLP